MDEKITKMNDELLQQLSGGASGGDWLNVEVTCSNCDYVDYKYLSRDTYNSFLQHLDMFTCAKCRSFGTYIVREI